MEGGEPVGGNPMVDNGPGSLGQRVSLDAAVHQVDRLRRSDEGVEGFAREKFLLGRLERLVRLDGLLEILAKLMGKVRGISGKTLRLPVHRGATRELGFVRVLLITHKELRKNANGLQPGKWMLSTQSDEVIILCAQEEYSSDLRGK